MANTVKYNIFLNKQKFKIANKNITTTQTEQSFTIPSVGQADTTSNITLTNGISTTLTLKRNSTGSIGVYFEDIDTHDTYLLLCYNETQNKYSSGSGSFYIDDEGAVGEGLHNLTMNDSFTIYLIDVSPDTIYEFMSSFDERDIRQVVDSIPYSSFNILFSVTHTSGSNVVISSNSSSTEINYERVIDISNV